MSFLLIVLAFFGTMNLLVVIVSSSPVSEGEPPCFKRNYINMILLCYYSERLGIWLREERE